MKFCRSDLWASVCTAHRLGGRNPDVPTFFVQWPIVAFIDVANVENL